MAMNEPKVRFKGIDREWNEVRLGQLLEINNDKNTRNVYNINDVLSISDEAGVVNQIDFLGRSFAGKSVSNYKILKKNQIVYTKSPLKAKPFGIIKISLCRTGIVSVLYAVYDAKENVCPEYIHYYFDPAFRLNKYLLPLVNKGAKNTMNISDEMALSGNIKIPALPEQRKIAAYFQSLDALIQAATKKLEAIKRIKAASLQVMFPQEGETTPKVRFKGFEGEWRKVAFGALIKECLDKSTVENEDILLSSAITGIYLNSELFSHQRGVSNIGYKKIKKNMLILSAQNLHLGNANVNLKYEHGLISPAYKIFYLIDVFPQFMHQWIKKESTKKFFLNATTAGASLCRKNIVWNDLYKQFLVIPSYQEQIKIGNYFSNLDNQISLYSKRLEKLKQIKAACLDKMFV